MDMNKTKTTVNENHKAGDIYQNLGDKYEYLGEKNGRYIFKPLGDTIYIEDWEGNVPFCDFPESFKKVEK